MKYLAFGAPSNHWDDDVVDFNNLCQLEPAATIGGALDAILQFNAIEPREWSFGIISNDKGGALVIGSRQDKPDTNSSFGVILEDV